MRQKTASFSLIKTSEISHVTWSVWDHSWRKVVLTFVKDLDNKGFYDIFVSILFLFSPFVNVFVFRIRWFDHFYRTGAVFTNHSQFPSFNLILFIWRWLLTMEGFWVRKHQQQWALKEKDGLTSSKGCKNHNTGDEGLRIHVGFWRIIEIFQFYTWKSSFF